MNPWISRNLVYRPIYASRRERVELFGRDIHKFHTLPAEQMQEIQWDKLIRLLKYLSVHNPYYRALFCSNGVSVDSIRSYAEFARIPILTKETMRHQVGMMSSNGSWKVAARKTAGSTGIPLHFAKDRTACAYNDALMYAVYEWRGVRMGDKQGRFWGLPLDLRTRLKWQAKDILLNRKRFNSFNITSERSVSFYHDLKRFHPKYFYGYPSAICEFAALTELHGLHVRDLGISTIITTGEMLFPAQRRQLEEVFACEVANEYGSTENGIIAFECRERRMHLMNHNLFIEVLDPSAYTRVKPGERGVVVVTELHSYALPFVRYRLGDMLVPSDQVCPCGVALPIVESIEGRVSDLIIAADGSRISGPVINYTMASGVRRFKAVQQSRQEILILIEPGTGFEESDLKLIRDRWHTLVGQEVTIDIRIVENIPADPSGKLRAFESRLHEHERPSGC